MNVLLTIVAGLLPAVVLVFYIYLLDKNQREPLPWILKAVLYGVLCAIPAIFIEELLSLVPIPEGTLGSALYNAFVVAALTEESMKLLFLWLLLRKNPYFDERMDCIVYATCVSMGFAGLENVGYLFENIDNLASVAVMRAMLSVPGHFFNGVFMGYFMSLYYWGKSGKRHQNWLLILLAPVILHGVYDGCLMAMPLSEKVMVVALLLFLALGIYVWVVGHRHIWRVLARDKKHMHFANPLHQEGCYNKNEHVAAPFSESAEMDDEKKAPFADVSENLVTAKGGEEDEVDKEEEVGTDDPARAQGVFSRPFSFEGRISRKEFAYSYLIYIVWYQVLDVALNSDELPTGMALFIILSILPMMWFITAQSCKRCHDVGHSGWWQLIPYYFLFLLFQKGDPTPNEYGDSL